MTASGSVPISSEKTSFTILIVEDNPADRAVLRLLLEENAAQKFACIECPAGKNALELLRSTHADCVLLDLNLPDVDGLQLLQTMMGEPDPSAVVVITAYGSEQIAVDAMKTGASDYVVKGTIAGDTLGRAVRNAIEKRALRRHIEQQRVAIEERNGELQSALQRESASRRNAEQSEARYRVLAEAMPQIVWTSNPNGSWNYVNERWTRVTGASDKEALGDGWLRFVDEVDRNGTAAEWNLAVKNGTAVEFECRLATPSGDTRLQLVRAVPVPGNDEPVRWVGTFTDIEDQRRTEELLRNRQKLESIGILASGVAHDFNNLLVGIVGGVSYALDVLPEDHGLRSILELGLKSGERGADLTRQLMAYAGQAAFNPKDIDLATNLRDNEDLMRVSLPRSIELKVVIPSDLPPVHADPTQLNQIMMNLVRNAGEAIPNDRPGVIVINAFPVDQHTPKVGLAGNAPPGKYVGISVRDNGCGMDAALVQKIFDPFFTTKFDGRGLGLAAVQGIVRSNQGSVEVESTLDKGSTFHVFLPAGKSAAVSESAGSRGPVASAVGRILVVDDEPFVRATAKAILVRLGHLVETASTGREALERIQASPDVFSMVLLDFSMPGVSGEVIFDAIHAIRKDLPVVICSGYSEKELQTRFASRGIAGFLQKPFRSEALLKKVSQFLVPA